MKPHPRHTLPLAGLLAAALWGCASHGVSDTTTPPAPKTEASTKPDTQKDGERPAARPWDGDPTGPNGAFEDPNRAHTLRIDDVMDKLGITKGSVVADVGAGGGWLSMLLARRVGTTGIVYAQEISGRYTRYIKRRAEREKLTNVRTILGTPADPKLPANKLDAVIILNAYHEFDKQLTMLRKIRTSLKPGGRLGFIERDTDKLRQEANEAYEKTGKIKRRVTEESDGKSYTDDHRLALPIVEREAKEAGFKKVSVLELRDDHYLLVVARD